MQDQVPDVPEVPEDAPLTFDALVYKHAQFLNEMSKLKVTPFTLSQLRTTHCVKL